MPLIRSWPDGAGAHPSRMADIESLLLSLTTVAVLPYSASITPDAAVAAHATIAATNGTAFTINAPANAAAGRQLTIDVTNSSGGSLGTVTWNAVFKLAGSFTNPANGKRRTITFKHDGSNWVEVNRAAADI